MTSAFYIFEAVLYSFTNFFPYLLLALFPFRDSLRFSKTYSSSYFYSDAASNWHRYLGYSF